MTNLDSILKSRYITLSTKVCLVKAMVFPIVMYGYESWAIKKVGRRRIDAFGVWCWRRFLRVPWTSRRSNQSILKEISPGCSLEGLMLKLQYFGHLMRRADSFEKTLMLGKSEGERRREWQMMRWLDGITDSMDTSLSKLWELWWTGRPCVLQSMGSQRVGHDWATELNRTELRHRSEIGGSWIRNKGPHYSWQQAAKASCFHSFSVPAQVSWGKLEGLKWMLSMQFGNTELNLSLL